MSLIFVLNSLGLGVGLAMDAFSVSLANGLHEPRMTPGRTCAIAGVYGLFQTAMPLLGWVCVKTVEDLFSTFRRLIPWIALGLLLYIGGKMLLEGLNQRRHPEQTEQADHRLRTRDLLLQGIATSIDALSVGFTLASYRATAACTSAMLIGGVTFVICLAGLLIGRRAGTRLSWKASVLGGVILMAIGIEIFVKGVL